MSGGVGMASLVSVIVPAYNAEKVLAKCIRSICESTYQDLEIIIVNDGSKDKTLEVAESFAGLDSRIAIINQTNQGVSSARNAGIEVASGKYLSFIDADDYISPYFFESLVSLCDEQGADIACARLKIVDSLGKDLQNNLRSFSEILTMTPQDIAFNYFRYYQLGIINNANKLFRREFLGDTRFSTRLKWGEDGSFNIELFRKMNFQIAIPDKLYIYVQHPNQTTANKMPGYGDMQIEHMGDIHQYLSDYGAYSSKEVREGMGSFWFETIITSVFHSQDCRSYKALFKRMKQEPWSVFISSAKVRNFKWTIMKFLVLHDLSGMIFYLNCLYHNLQTKKRKNL